MMKKINAPSELNRLQEELRSRIDPDQPVIALCSGTGCLAYGTRKLEAALRAEIEKRGLGDRVLVRITGCHGFCERGPLMVIHPQKILYQRVQVEDVEDIIQKTILEGQVVDRLLYTDPVSKEKIVYENEVPFYKQQMRLVLGANGHIDPTAIEDYLALGGYAALGKVIAGMQPQQVIDEIIKAGLRGRGGGGYPAGLKWDAVRKAAGQPKYVICNADEGDPGAYMDRSVLEGNPHAVLEGMVIGAFAIGSSNGYIYVRNEYPLAVENITQAIEQAQAYGLLGDNILGSGFSFHVTINRGGGAFVCGESSALFASIEGRSGEPRAKYVHATEKGLYDKPTNLNNVETWANVPLIIGKGADWYGGIGTEASKGTKIFSLVGKINNTGLVEVPMGITLREIIHGIGGGIPKGRKFKAVQTGGPSGGCIPEAHLDTPVDFDALTKLGSMMGSGGMIVMDDRTCMVDVAKYFLKFLEDESCGKCTPCREGILQMRRILDRITSGQGREEDIDTLEWMGAAIRDGSLCALGGSAPNPVLTTLRYFRDEYMAHIKEGRCPAGVCKALIHFSVDPENCTGCHACARICPTQAATGEKKKVHAIDPALCIKCGACFDACKFDAVLIQ
jgi:NADH-quinone oxidoreductase subunit F